jgi:hypothetical protein
MPSPRRFPPPWIVDEHPKCFIVCDATGQALGYFYFEDEPGRRSAAKGTGVFGSRLLPWRLGGQGGGNRTWSSGL